MKNTLKSIVHESREAITVTIVLMIICGFLFPCFMTLVSKVVFPHQASGSLVEVNGEAVGSALVGQEFVEDYHMWSRPSAYHYNVYVEKDGGQFYNDGTEYAGLGSGSNNYAPSNPALRERVENDMDAFLEKNPDVKPEEIPTDLLTASGSGLDPHITPASARIQIPRIAEASGLSVEEIQNIIDENTKGKLFGILGEEVVNVLGVNIAIDEAML